VSSSARLAVSASLTPKRSARTVKSPSPSARAAWVSRSSGVASRAACLRATTAANAIAAAANTAIAAHAR
jgi:hypothetical protein